MSLESVIRKKKVVKRLKKQKDLMKEMPDKKDVRKCPHHKIPLYFTGLRWICPSPDCNYEEKA